MPILIFLVYLCFSNSAVLWLNIVSVVVKLYVVSTVLTASILLSATRFVVRHRARSCKLYAEDHAVSRLSAVMSDRAKNNANQHSRTIPSWDFERDLCELLGEVVGILNFGNAKFDDDDLSCP